MSNETQKYILYEHVGCSRYGLKNFANLGMPVSFSFHRSWCAAAAAASAAARWTCTRETRSHRNAYFRLHTFRAAHFPPPTLTVRASAVDNGMTIKTTTAPLPPPTHLHHCIHEHMRPHSYWSLYSDIMCVNCENNGQPRILLDAI